MNHKKDLTEIITEFKSGIIPQFDQTQTQTILNYVLELQDEVNELTDKIDDLSRELKMANHDPKRCDCGFRGNQVLINGGRCSSCM